MRPQTVTITGTGGTSLVIPADLYSVYGVAGMQITVTGTAGTANVFSTVGDVWQAGAASGTGVVWGTSDVPSTLRSVTGTQAYGVITNLGYTGYLLTVTGADAAAVTTLRMVSQSITS